MLIDKRTFLGSALSAVACWSTAAACATAEVLHPEDFGARGDGTTDDTRAIQRCIDEAPLGATIRLRRGAVYRIDTNYQPTRETVGGIKLKSRQILELNGAELRALPSSRPHGSVVQAHRVHDWKIVGPGRIVGEREIHRGKGGEWGMGISVWSCNGWAIEPGVEVADCWGDGLFIGNAIGGGASESFLVSGIAISGCRRNGISIVAARNGEIRAPRIQRIRGTAPEGGIDLEPDDRRRPNQNIKISGGTIRDVGVGIYMTVANDGIVVTGMDIEGDNSGIIVGDNSRNVRVEANPRIASRMGGTEGAAIRTVAKPATIDGLVIRNNGLAGGGFFVLDIFGTEYRNLQVVGNRIEATNPGVQGAARLGAATFTDNIVTLGSSAGKEGDYFLHLNSVSYGRNVYRSQSRYNMYAAIRASRDLGGDRYESRSLRSIVE